MGTIAVASYTKAGRVLKLLRKTVSVSLSTLDIFLAALKTLITVDCNFHSTLFEQLSELKFGDTGNYSTNNAC